MVAAPNATGSLARVFGRGDEAGPDTRLRHDLSRLPVTMDDSP
jgi:hypothetical protein